MSAPLSRVAETRLAAGRALPQRYGLSVMLRKPYPAFGGAPSTIFPIPNMSGANARIVRWDELPAGLLELVRRRAAEDPVVALQVVQQPQVYCLDIPASADATITSSRESASPRESRRGIPGDGIPGETLVGTDFLVVRLGEGARARWFAPCPARPGFTFVERLALVERGATFEYHGAAVAAEALRETVHVVLAGEGAAVRVRTLFVGAANHQFDFGVTVVHAAPHTTSDLRAKGVLGGRAQGVYRGLVRVEKDARGSDGYQRCDALLLSPTAEVDPIPKLEIETNDVRCTHGVTVSHLNPEQLFYLESRGLTEAAARDLLVEGFAEALLRPWPRGERETLRRNIREVLSRA